MEAHVYNGRAAPNLLVPSLDAFHYPEARILRCHIDDRGRAAKNRRDGTGGELVRGDCAERLAFHVRVAINAAWNDEHPFGVDRAVGGHL